MNEKILQAEQQHLTEVHTVLTQDAQRLSKRVRAATDAGRQAKQNLAGDVRLNFDSFADNVDTFAAIETANREIDGRNSQLASMGHRLHAAELLLKQPYFARIDLRYQGEDEDEPLYIGKVGYATDMQEDLVYDWRAPVADVYYTGKFGQVEYEAVGRTIAAELNLRRQFVLEGPVLHSYVDSQTAVTDPLLLQALAQARGDKMRDITTTIQAEQNAVIRNRTAQVLIVDGVAGSGKTSVLLQRVAYQLFRHRGEWVSADVLLMTPSKMFARYTEDVLPELGETNPLQVPLVQFLGQLGRRFGLTVTPEDAAQLDLTAVTQVLDAPLPENVVVKGGAGDARRVTTAFKRTATDAPVIDRLQTTFIALQEHNVQLEAADWLTWLASQNWWGNLTANTAAGLYVYTVIARYQQRNVRALFVDEAQDYSRSQLQVLAQLFKHAEITLLGDHDQTLRVAAAPFLDFAELVPGLRTELIGLHTSYRATAGITAFFAQFADRGPGLSVGSVQPDTTPPDVLPIADEDDWIPAVRTALPATHDSVAVIVANAQAATGMTAALSDSGVNCALVTADKPIPATGMVAVVPLALAKGLEFDHAVVCIDVATYPDTVLGRHRLYVACSRATKKLTVVVRGANALLPEA